jgi:transcriptional antiterminator RfaH
MPLLPLEPFIFPDNLLTAPGEDPGCWWVLHTKPRAEKSLARKLLRQTTPFFLPVCKRQWRNKGRLHSSHLPLFPGYLFLQGDEHSVFRTLETNLVVKILPVNDQHQLRNDLSRVYTLITTGAPLTPEDRLQPGTQVEIVNGPLAGMEGKVLRKGKQLKLFVEVQLLQRGVSVEIESWMLSALTPLPVEV